MMELQCMRELQEAACCGDVQRVRATASAVNVNLTCDKVCSFAESTADCTASAWQGLFQHRW